MGIIDLFYEKTPKAETKPPVKRQSPSLVEAPAITVGWTPTATSIDLGQVEEFKRRFQQILDDENKRNFPGNDYYEFKVMKDAMNAIPQENIRYQAAFAGWMTGGNQTKESLLKTANIYLGLVDKEIQDFETAYQNQYQTQVAQNEKLITLKEADIAEFRRKADALATEVLNLKQQSAANTQGLVGKHTAFMQAGGAKKQEILDEIDNIKKYIN